MVFAAAFQIDAVQVKSVNQTLVVRMKGRILLQVEAHGEAWYVDPVSGKKYYMKDGQVAYSLMRSFGVGISDADLAKIPTGPNDKNVDKALVNRMKGKILLQVQQHGEAWYVNPVDGYRYYLKDGQAAYQIMRKLGAGIANKDLRTISVGTIK
jgi:regulator of sirC expression with transglutaminase-like and TPR domain